MSHSYIMNITDIDLGYYDLHVAVFNVSINDGIQTLDVSLNSGITEFKKYDEFISDIQLMSRIRREAGKNPAIEAAFEQLLTIMALHDVST